jgi:predicted MFS family arabinose efflux permease
MESAKTGFRHSIQTVLIRAYVLCFLAFFSFLAASHALNPTIPIYLVRLGTFEREIGILVGVFGVASLLSRFFAGGLLRRYPEKLIMLWSATLFILVYLALILFRPFWPFFMARIFQGFAFACFDTAAISYVIRIIPPENRPQAISYLLIASPLSSALVASVSVLVLNEYSFAILLLGCTGLSICALLFSWKLKPEGTGRSREASTTGSGLFFEPRILAPALISFLFSFSWGGLAAFFPLYAIQCGVTNPGHFFTAMAVVLIVARLTGGKILDTYRKEKILPIFILISMAALLILAFSKTQPMFIFVGMLWGIGAGFFPPVSLAYALEYAGSSDGTAVGTYQAAMDSGFGLGPMITGIIVPLTGYAFMFLCLACICLLNVCYFQFYLRKRQRR